MFFWVWLNTYFVSSSSSAPPMSDSRSQSDQWCPVPGRAGARHDGSDPGRRCMVSKCRVGGDDDGNAGFCGGGGAPGRCVTVQLAKSELDRTDLKTLDNFIGPNFTVRRRLFRVKFGWRRGSVVRTSVFGSRTFLDLRLICG